MSDRIASDHPSVVTHDGTLKRVGRTSRLRVVFDADLPTDEVVRLILDGTTYRTRFEEARGGVALTGAYDTASAARDPASATDRLQEWLDEHDLSEGRTVHLDVVEEGFAYGLRAPGERAVYDAVEPPSEGLADIARSLEDG